MQGKLTIIPADPARPIKQSDLTAAPTLDALQKIVGGDIQAVPLFTTYGTDQCVAFCAEEGKLNGSPYNGRASRAWRDAVGVPIDDVLMGDVVIIIGDAEMMEAL